MVVELATVTVAAIIIQHVIENNGPKLSKKLVESLGGNNVKKGLQKVISTAVSNYGTTYTRLQLSKYLQDKQGLFSETEVTTEIAKLIAANSKPSAEIIGRYWEKLVKNDSQNFTEYASPLNQINFTFEAQTLLDLIYDELKISPTFQNVCETNNLESIDDGIQTSNEELRNISIKLETMVHLLETSFMQINPSNNKNNISKYVEDFTSYFIEKIEDFVGRQYVVKQIDNFIKNNTRGYYKISGEPGIGKTSFSVDLITKRGYIHHFNDRSRGINKSSDFLRNICAQLIIRYSLDYDSLPDDVAENSKFLSKLLQDVSKKLNKDEKAIIVVDALDEVDLKEQTNETNVLFLPKTIPNGIYFILTMRHDSNILLTTDCENESFLLKHDSVENITDTQNYILNQIQKYEHIQKFITASKDSEDIFVKYLSDKSKGNFIYLKYVLHDLSLGVYPDGCFDSIPTGLQGYYKDHWEHMKRIDPTSWNEYSVPVLSALTVALKPISVDLIKKFTNIEKRSRIRKILEEWGQFLHIDTVKVDNDLIKMYSLYHSSFFDFIRNMDQIKDERIDLKESENKIVHSLLPDDY